MKQTMFEWRKSGRSWVADIGRLSLIVDERGSLATGLRWRVRSVFGAQSLGSGWQGTLLVALHEAEELAIREGVPSLRKLVAVSSKAKGRR